jgi:molecular chaperone GrpE (heat shock protein)
MKSKLLIVADLGIELEASLGRPFGPLYHEAVSVRHDPSQPDHVILETFQRGYRRGNEVFRPAKVVVNDLRHTDDGTGPVDSNFRIHDHH